MLNKGWRRGSDSGAAAVETALCLCFVVIPLVFATIGYAYMLSFRQTVSQSAAEGARAAAVAPTTDNTARAAAATNAATQAMASGPGGLKCGEDNLTCTVRIDSCPNTTGNCAFVTVSYPYRDHSLLPSVPGLGFTLPQTISYSAVAEVS